MDGARIGEGAGRARILRFGATLQELRLAPFAIPLLVPLAGQGRVNYGHPSLRCMCLTCVPLTELMLRMGVCRMRVALEAEGRPDSLNHAGFPEITLEVDEMYRRITEYRLFP